MSIFLEKSFSAPPPVTSPDEDRFFCPDVSSRGLFADFGKLNDPLPLRIIKNHCPSLPAPEK